MHSPETPFSWIERLSAAASNQPVRRGRPVVAPNSWPRWRSRSPTSSGQFRRKRSFAHARAVGLGDAEHVVQVHRPDAGAGCRRAGDAVGRSHERIGAMVDVEQRALRALEQQVLARLVGVVQRARHVGDQGHQARRERQRFIESLPEVDFRLLVPVLQDEIMVFEQLLQFLREACRLEQVLKPDRAARDLVLVGRADTRARWCRFSARPSSARAPGRARRGTAGSAGRLPK